MMHGSLLLVIIFVVLSSLVAGCILIPFAYRVPGIHTRTRGVCAAHEDRQIATIRGRGGSGYRPVWNVAVYKDENSTNSPLYDDVAAFNGDLSSTNPYHKHKSDAVEALLLFPAGEVVPCIYPSHPLHYPSGGNVFNTRAVFIGNYTNSQMDKGHSKAQGLLISGIVLLAGPGGMGLLAFIGYFIFRSYKFEIGMRYRNWKTGRFLKNMK